jgi:hypothetical protein
LSPEDVGPGDVDVNHLVRHETLGFEHLCGQVIQLDVAVILGYLVYLGRYLLEFIST